MADAIPRLAASAAVFCTQPHVIVLKYGDILGKTYFGFPAELSIFKCLKTFNSPPDTLCL